MNSYNYGDNGKMKIFKNIGLKLLAFGLAVLTVLVVVL